MQRLRELKDKVQRGSVNIKDTFARGIVGDAGTSSPSIVDVRTQQRKLRADRDEEGQLGSKRQSAAEREEDRSRRERELMLENLEPQYMDEVRCSQSHLMICCFVRRSRWSLGHCRLWRSRNVRAHSFNSMRGPCGWTHNYIAWLAD